MKYSRLLAMAALAGSLALPATAAAQGSNYGIFGNGTGQNGGFNSSGSGSSFGRSSGFGQTQFGSAGQQGFGGGIGSVGRTSALGVGSGNAVSPYLNLLRPGTSTAVNYYALVRPQIRQDALNTQYSNNIQQADRLLSNQQQWMRQTLEPLLNPSELPPSNNKVEPTAPQPEPRRRVASSTSNSQDADFHDWASDFRDQANATEPKSALDSRQREAKLRQAKELKELEKELLGESANSTGSASQTQTSAPQTQGRGLPSNLGPAGLNSLRSTNHYFPPQGATNNRMGMPR